eukprot:scaffold54971_cov47-Attheya_sp.AAC.5
MMIHKTATVITLLFFCGSATVREVMLRLFDAYASDTGLCQSGNHEKWVCDGTNANTNNNFAGYSGRYICLCTIQDGTPPVAQFVCPDGNVFDLTFDICYNNLEIGVDSNSQWWDIMVQFDNPDCIEQYSSNPDYDWGDTEFPHGNCTHNPESTTSSTANRMINGVMVIGMTSVFLLSILAL